MMRDMDDYVDWEKAGPEVGVDAGLSEDPILNANPEPQRFDNAISDMILSLENEFEDDFSLNAIEHFARNATTPAPYESWPDPSRPQYASFQSNRGSPNGSEQPLETTLWDIPSIPCSNCAVYNLSCRIACEGRHEGECLKCVEGHIECSFGGVRSDNVNPESTFLPASAPVMTPGSTQFEAISKWTAGLDPCPTVPAADSGLSSANADDQSGFSSDMESNVMASSQTAPPKIGTRISRSNVRILSNWLTSHNLHPYPTKAEKAELQRQTGLDSVQVTNWFANARRRGKGASAGKAAWPSPKPFTSPIDIPASEQRSDGALDPLQRWQHSPPEHEPCELDALARAIDTTPLGQESPLQLGGTSAPAPFNYLDDGSSACSLGTSRSSGGSLRSSFSRATHSSWDSLGAFSQKSLRTGQPRRRRKPSSRRAVNAKRSPKTCQSAPFQCTFCTRTFKTKFDWQRHEKSMHLSLEQWVCAPLGPRIEDTGVVGGSKTCVFCGADSPDDDHLELHNHAVCAERPHREKTFYRKDHLRQHLKLVHGVEYKERLMSSWKMAMPRIRSQCGFCGIYMDDWETRVEHLAEHYRGGFTMSDWAGDWGLESHVAAMVENGIPASVRASQLKRS